jgi:hypothetical protein
MHLAQNNSIPQRLGGSDDNANEDFLACRNKDAAVVHVSQLVIVIRLQASNPQLCFHM